MQDRPLCLHIIVCPLYYWFLINFFPSTPETESTPINVILAHRGGISTTFVDPWIRMILRDSKVQNAFLNDPVK